MKTISLKIEDDIFQEAEKILSKQKISRNRYINMAIESFNAQERRKILSQQLKKESTMVKDDSMIVLQEFENLGDINV
ncbi:MAG: hypothetical protein KDC49_00680 [Saprospiraceae bacterium]|nr:hypothetical protein [Saprospiraceae bacterium]